MKSAAQIITCCRGSDEREKAERQKQRRCNEIDWKLSLKIVKTQFKDLGKRRKK